MRRLLATVLILAAGAVGARPQAQAVAAEYRVKAGYLYNFVKFVEWPPDVSSGPLLICVAGRNPFGTMLEDLVANELIGGRPIEARVILEPDPACNVVFIPDGAASGVYLRAAARTPTLTVGESPTFLEQGGVINFYINETGNVRFEINTAAADRARLQISSRLLKLARLVPPPAP